MRSALVLAKETEAGKEDGFLEAREVAEMRLTAQLAVLSACESGQGQKSGGEGPDRVGLGISSGRRSGDCRLPMEGRGRGDERKLMVAFYKALKAGRRKDEALRQAMLAVKKMRPQPFYWAAFQVIGDTKPLPKALLSTR